MIKSFPVIGVHGFEFDPTILEEAPTELYKLWASESRGPFIGHEWFSVPFSFKNVWGAWKTGHRGCYHWAWDLAIAERERLRSVIRYQAEVYGKDVVLVGHSLGSRVILAALNTPTPLPVKRVLFFSGADSCSHARGVLPNLRAEVLNVIVEDDKTLKWPGEWLSPKLGHQDVIGLDGLGRINGHFALSLHL